MAIWQFQLVLVPNTWRDSGDDFESIVDEDGYDLSDAWKGFSANRILPQLGSLLPTGKSWSDDVTIWGDERRDDIRLCECDGQIVDLAFRFDVRCPNQKLFEAVARFAEETGLVLLDLEHGLIVEHTASAISQAAEESAAARYVSNPHAFISELAKDDRSAT